MVVAMLDVVEGEVGRLVELKIGELLKGCYALSYVVVACDGVCSWRRIAEWQCRNASIHLTQAARN